MRAAGYGEGAGGAAGAWKETKREIEELTSISVAGFWIYLQKRDDERGNLSPDEVRRRRENCVGRVNEPGGGHWKVGRQVGSGKEERLD